MDTKAEKEMRARKAENESRATVRATVVRVECQEFLSALDEASVDAVVTDPPYGLSFMGKGWDYQVPGKGIWEEVLRVLKPGGHLLSFFGSRTYHRGVVEIEDAGFEIRDCVMWVYGSGFPKSLDVGKAIDKEAGVKREKVQPGNQPAYQRSIGSRRPYMDNPDRKIDGPDPVTEAARQWNGWGTALKPAHEPIVLARKPLIGTVASNVQEWGTGALNIGGCRVTDGSETGGERPKYKPNYANQVFGRGKGGGAWENTDGRWPANLIHDGSDESATLFGDAARFFYCAKASKSDRGPGNTHPTVKPTALMRYLVRLVTPPGGTVLDPFCGSGSTGVACVLEGFRFLGIEQDEQYATIAKNRIKEAQGR